MFNAAFRHQKKFMGNGRTRLLRLTLCVCFLLVAGCQTPFNDDEPTPTGTAVPVESVVPSVESTVAPVQTSTTPDGGLVIEALSPRPPVNPSGEQTLTLTGTPTGPTTLDPALLRDSGANFISRQLFRGLVRLDDDLNPVPELAQRIEISADRLHYTFVLLPNITFHDGRPITAEDVKRSFERATDPALMGGDASGLPAKTFLADISGAAERFAGITNTLDGVQVIDASTVQITLSQPVASFLLKLTGSPAYIVDVDQAAAGGEWWKSPNGSGPFTVSEWVAGDHIGLAAFDGYKPNPPLLRSVSILMGANAFQPLTLYERGQIDIASVPAYAIDRVQAPGSGFQNQLQVKPLLSGSYIFINPNIAPFDDLEFRRMLALVFPRTKVAEVSLDGHVQTAAGIVPPGMQENEWPAVLPEYDVEAARQILAQINAETLDDVVFYTAGDLATVSLKRVIEADLNLSVEVVQLEWADYIADLSSRQLPLFSLDWIADYPDPENFLRTLFHSTSPDNYLGYANSEVDQLLDAAQVESDPDRRAELFRQAQQLIIDDAVVIPLYHDVDHTVIQPYVRGAAITPIGLNGLESVWIER